MTEKKHNSLRKLYLFNKKASLIILAGLIMSAVSGMMDIYAPLLLSDLMDGFTEDVGHFVGTSDMVDTMILLAVICVISFVIATLKNDVISKGSTMLGESIRTKMLRKMDHIPFSKLIEMKLGDTTSVLNNDCNKITALSGTILDGTVKSTVLIVGSSIMMFHINPELALISIFPISSSMLLILFYAKTLDKYNYKHSKFLGRANDKIVENFYGHTIIKTTGSGERASRQFEKINGIIRKRTNRMLNGVLLIPSFMKFLTNVSYVSICGYGLLLVQDGDATFGTLVAALVYLRLFTEPIDDLSLVALSTKSLEAACDRVFDILEIEEFKNVSFGTKSEFKGEVEFRDVSLSYDGIKDAVHDCSFHAMPKDTVAIVGLSGSGKTSLVNLMMGFYKPTEGEIRIDGIPLDDLSRAQLNSLYSLVAQDSWIFKGTYRENIVYNSTNITEDDLMEIIRTVKLDYVLDYPDGLDTYIDDPTKLSMGQKQLICVARAMAHKTPILIMDEITNSIDIVTERAIIDSIRRMRNKRTTFVIAHRLSTIKAADLIIVMENGNMREIGTMDELIEKRGLFYELISLQNNPNS